MSVKILTICENHAITGTGMTAEHGLCFLIETGDDRRILFDTGQGLVFSHNMDAVGVDCASIDTVVLSHGHYDHTGGLRDFIERASSFQLIAHPEAFENKLASVDRTHYRDIGFPFDKKLLESEKVTLRLSDKPVQIDNGITTTGEIPFVSDFEEVDPVFFKREEGRIVPDTIPDDQALILETDKGIAVVLGCTHRGIINTLTHVCSLTGEKKIHAVMGGLHLGAADDVKMNRVIDSLRAFDIDRMIIGHCTGMKASIDLYNAFKGTVFFNASGNRILF